eukprot:10529_1
MHLFYRQSWNFEMLSCSSYKCHLIVIHQNNHKTSFTKHPIYINYTIMQIKTTPPTPNVLFKTHTDQKNAVAIDFNISYKRPKSSIVGHPDPIYRDDFFTNPLCLQKVQKWEYMITANRWLPGEGTFIAYNNYRYIIGAPIHLGINGHIHYCYRYLLPTKQQSLYPPKQLFVETFVAKIIPNKKIFKREFDILKKLQNCENVTTLYEIIKSKQTLIAIIELAQADGYNFFTGDNITKYHGWNLNKIAVREYFAKMIISNIVNGLDSVHKCDYLHCDVKTLNILLFIYGTTNSIHKGGVYVKAKLTDFGHSVNGKYYITPSVHYNGMSKVGTAGYVAPELFIKGTKCDYKIDIWALGMVLFAILIPKQLLFGEYSSLEELKLKYKYWICNDGNYKKKPIWWTDFQSLSLEVRDLIYWLTQWNPEDRPSCEEILKHPWFLLGKKGYMRNYKPNLKYVNIDESIAYE